MNNIFNKTDYFFNNIYPYLSVEEQKSCIKELGLEPEIKDLTNKQKGWNSKELN